MTTPKPRKKPLSRDKATLHAQIRALEKQLAAVEIERFWLRELRDATMAYYKNYMLDEADDDYSRWQICTDEQHLAARRVFKALANAGEKT